MGNFMPIIKLKLETKDGVVYWKDGNNKGKEAGWDNGKGYLKLKLLGKSFYVHKLAYALYHGYYPEHVVDHIDHNRKNNSKENLVKSNHLDNSRNQSSQSVNKNYPGVSFRTSHMKWHARLGQKHIGYFDTEEDAINAKKIVEKENGYHDNHGN